mgnify:CR=1 FL=1
MDGAEGEDDVSGHRLLRRVVVAGCHHQVKVGLVTEWTLDVHVHGALCCSRLVRAEGEAGGDGGAATAEHEARVWRRRDQREAQRLRTRERL